MARSLMLALLLVPLALGRAPEARTEPVAAVFDGLRTHTQRRLLERFADKGAIRGIGLQAGTPTFVVTDQLTVPAFFIKSRMGAAAERLAPYQLVVVQGDKWVVVGQSGAFATAPSVSASCVAALRKLQAAGTLPRSVALHPRVDAWAIVDANGRFQHGGRARSHTGGGPTLGAVQADLARTGRRVDCFTFLPGGAWILVADKWVAGMGLETGQGASLRRFFLDRPRHRVDHIVPTGPGKLGVFSNGISRVRRGDSVTRFERGMGGARGLDGTMGRNIRQFRSLSVAVGDGDKQLWTRAYGAQDPREGWNAPALTNTIYNMASISKAIASLGFLRLAAKREDLDLDADLLDDDLGLPALAGGLRSLYPNQSLLAGRPLTARRLMSHASGLEFNGGGTGVSGFPRSGGRTLDPGLDARGRLNALVTGATVGGRASTPRSVVATGLPGARSRYSGANYILLEALLYDRTGIDFPALMQRELIGPLGLRSTTFVSPPPARGSGVRAHPFANDNVPRSYPQHAAAGLSSTPGEMLKFGQLVLNRGRTYPRGRGKPARVLINPAQFAQLTNGAYPNQATQRVAWNIANEGLETECWWHGGAHQGFRTWLVVFPKKNLVFSGAATGWANNANKNALLDRIFKALRDTHRTGWFPRVGATD